MRTGAMKWYQRLLLEVAWGAAWLFSILPYWFKYYVVEEVLFFLLYHVLHYRRKVVLTNLENSFPDKSEAERRDICRKFYRTLAEMFIDTINMAHMPERKAKRVFCMKDFETQRRAVHGRDWIAMTAHFGCWEYCSYWSTYEQSQVLAAVYHPLHSVVIEELYHRLRRSDHVVTVPMRESLRFYLRNRGKEPQGRNLVIGLIADQNPPFRPDSHWFRFLNQDTIFFDGGEKLAVKCHLPVYFVKMKRLCRGRYEALFEKIYDGESEVQPNEITESYVRKLEAMICECPELWMWSHRRWKYIRPHDAD